MGLLPPAAPQLCCLPICWPKALFKPLDLFTCASQQRQLRIPASGSRGPGVPRAGRKWAQLPCLLSLGVLGPRIQSNISCGTWSSWACLTVLFP